MHTDPSNGYERVAETFIAHRGTRPANGDAIGATIIRTWAQALSKGATVLDLGAGPGEPSTRVLREAGLTVFALDASPTMVAAFRKRFPDVPVECSAAETSNLFGRDFDGVLAWALLFLLEPSAQEQLIQKVARALKPGGRFLFTAPAESLEWLDAMTGRPSRSLGAAEYERLLRAAGLTWVDEAWDEGGNHYYFVARTD